MGLIFELPPEKKGKSNKSIGNKLEEEICQVFGKYGWWSHNMAQGRTGQPADIIAVRNDHAVLLDAKHCKGDYFDTRRMEFNQISAMTRWRDANNGYCGFALAFDSKPGIVFLVPFEYLHKFFPHRIRFDALVNHSRVLEEFARGYMHED